MKPSIVPKNTVRRLFLYYRILLESRETNVISSEKLAELTGFSAAQIRKDLTYFGQFGTPGRGYEVTQLQREIKKILGIDREWEVALVGFGNLGKALLRYNGFKAQGFRITAVFDKDPTKTGEEYIGIKVRDITELTEIITTTQIKIAIVAVPVTAVQGVVDLLVKTGIKAILNFVPARVKVPPEIKLLNIDMANELARLSYYLTRESFNGLNTKNGDPHRIS